MKPLVYTKEKHSGPRKVFEHINANSALVDLLLRESEDQVKR